MTAPTNGHGHGHGHAPAEEPPFMPEAHFAVQVQQDEINTLRTSETFLKDRVIYLRATILQIQAEAAHQASVHVGEIQNLRADVADLQRQLAEAQGAPDASGEHDPNLEQGVDLDDVVPDLSAEILEEAK